MSRLIVPQVGKLVNSSVLPMLWRLLITTMTRLISLLYLTILISLAGNLNAAESDGEFIRVYTELELPNNYIENENGIGPVVGYVTELVRAVIEDAEIDYEIELVPWVRAVQVIESAENVMVYPMARTSERENKYHWVGELLPLDFYLHGRKADIDTLPKTLEDAANARIGVIRADVTSVYMESQGFTNLVYVSSAARNLFMIERDRIDLFPYTELTIGSFLDANGFNPDDFVGVVKLDEISTGTYMVLSKDTDASIVDRLQKSYNKIVDDGRYANFLSPLYSQYDTLKVEVLD